MVLYHWKTLFIISESIAEEREQMRAWLEIEMDNLLFNINKIRERVYPKEIMAVVKANSYGFGAKEVVKYLSKNGVKIFAVACLEEALELREAGIKDEILILGVVLEDEILVATENDIQITVGNWEQIEFIKKHNLNVGIHIKIDTGMGRLGFLVDEGIEVVEYCSKNNLNIMGIYSHLSDADGFNGDADSYTRAQIEKFGVFKRYEDRVKYLHILNSGGILRFNEQYAGNLVRDGISMYGMIANYRVLDLKRVFTVKTKILSLRTVEEDSFISYGRKYTLNKGETFATIGMGYADGIKKEFSNKSYVIIEGEKCPLIGEICMDMSMVKIPESIKDKVKLGTEVIVVRDDIIEEINVEHKCSWDILTGIGRRVYRVYKENGKPYLITR